MQIIASAPRRTRVDTRRKSKNEDEWKLDEKWQNDTQMYKL